MPSDKHYLKMAEATGVGFLYYLAIFLLTAAATMLALWKSCLYSPKCCLISLSTTMKVTS